MKSKSNTIKNLNKYLVKETEESRLERNHVWKSLQTKVVTSKKTYNRNKFKKETNIY